jgi:hypothetical protein
VDEHGWRSVARWIKADSKFLNRSIPQSLKPYCLKYVVSREAREEEEREITTEYPLPASYNNEFEPQNGTLSL